MRFVIIGGGIAGTTAAEELRKLDENSEIILISEEQHPIYSRVLLANYVTGKTPRKGIFLKKPEWYGEKNIEFITGLRVQIVDPRNSFVGLSDGREIPFDKLLIASGAEVRTVGEDLRGMSYFRNLDDADHLVQLLGERKKNSRGGIYGGGFIACEYLRIFEQFQIPITIAFRGPRFWSRVFDEESGQLINDHLESRGVEVVPLATYKGPVGEKELEGFKTNKGSHPCSILGIGIGVVPDLSWLESSDIKLGSGVLTNEFLETNTPNVYAAGDIAEFDDLIVGRKLRVGTWLNAIMQGRIAAKNMMGDKKPFKLVSSYAENVLGLEVIFVGDTSRKDVDQIIKRGSVSGGGVTQLFVRGGKLVGATMVNMNTDRPPITKLIQSQENVLDHLEKWKNSNNELSL